MAKELMMAGRKKGAPIPAPDGERAFAVVVEQLRGDFRVFGESLGGLRQQVTDGFAAVDRRFEQVDCRFDQVERRFERVEHELGEMRVDLGLVKSAVHVRDAARLLHLTRATRRIADR
jgi:hypothetical protein